ncbi:hypothetical protein RUM43_000660 [Polyplax serrata]|uniref:Uncharacterized protein n=1 Tax=Polyplax serrata TaxID=468196 RepID=A0AAN8XNF4_POLSC
MVCKGPCLLNMKSGMVDGMLVGMLLGAAYGAYQVYRSDEPANTQKAAIDIADWSVHVAVVCALVGALLALARGV